MAKKPLLLIFPFGLLSHYLRCIVLAKELADTYEVLFLYHTKYADFLSMEGFGTFRCATMDESEIMAKAKKFDFSWLNDRSVESFYLSQLNIIKELKPVAVLGDALPTLKMAAESADVFYISLINGYLSKHYNGHRKLSRTHPAYSLLKNFGREITEKLTSIGESMAFSRIHRPFAKVRKKYGLAPKSSYPDEIEGDITLLCDLPEFFPQRDLPRQYEVCGPLVYDAQPEGALELDPDKKTLFVTMGSSGEWCRFSFLNDKTFACFNIVTAGDEQGVLNALNINSRKFIAAKDILPRADLVLCHAGNGTIYQALSFGVPLLCITSHFEQEWNLDRLCELGFGATLQDENPENYFMLINKWAEKKVEVGNAGVAAQIRQAPEKYLRSAAEKIIQISIDRNSRL